MPLGEGEVFADFTIIDVLGSGGTGTVYLAALTGAEVRVALKVFDPDVSADIAFRRRFERAVDIVVAIDDPNVVPIVDAGLYRGQLWVANVYVDGTNAGRLLRRRSPAAMPQRSVISIADHIARALDNAHRHGLVHGHVTPGNVLITDPLTEKQRAFLSDLGHHCGPVGSRISAAEHPYIAPEIRAGARPDPRSDQYSLAALVWQLQANGLPADPAEEERVDTVLTRALAVNPDDRFGSCSEFVLALKGPRSPTPDGSSSRSVLLIAAVALVLVGALTVAAVVFSKPKPPAQPSAVSEVPLAAGAPGGSVELEDRCARFDAAVAPLTLRQKLAQLLMVGVTDIDDARAVIRDHGVGGIFVASWTDLSMLTDGSLKALQEAPAALPLAVSVDEEGGRVQRLKALLGYQLSARELVARGTPVETVRQLARQRGLEMRSYGITIDFAPVVDVTDAPDNTVIGDRSFGNDLQDVITYAGAYAAGLRDAGLLPVLKHFPGHGRATGDSHLGGVTTPPLSSLMAEDLVPYRDLSTVHPVGVMVGHMQVPELSETLPASMSPATYSLLREGRYGGPAFSGPVFTDDLSTMKAITQHYSVPDAVLMALRAGADVALWVSTDEVPAVLDRLEQAVSNSELDMARLDGALKRVAALKVAELAC